MKFEWDEEKNIYNKMKHSISFETATLVISARIATEAERRLYYDQDIYY